MGLNLAQWWAKGNIWGLDDGFMNLFDLKVVEIFLLKLFGLEVIKRKLIIHKSGVPEESFFKGSLQHGMVAWHK